MNTSMFKMNNRAKWNVFKNAKTAAKQAPFSLITGQTISNNVPLSIELTISSEDSL